MSEEVDEEVCHPFDLETELVQDTHVDGAPPEPSATLRTYKYEVAVKKTCTKGIEETLPPLLLHVVFSFDPHRVSTDHAPFRNHPLSLEITVEHPSKPPPVVAPLVCERDTGMWRTYVEFGLPYLKGGNFVVTFGTNTFDNFSSGNIRGAYFLDNVAVQDGRNDAATGTSTDATGQRSDYDEEADSVVRYDGSEEE